MKILTILVSILVSILGIILVGLAQSSNKIRIVKAEMPVKNKKE